MADLFDPTSCPSPSPPQQPPSPPQTTSFTLESDDISSFLNTLLHNSSHPSTSSTTAHLIPPPENSRQFPGSAVFSETPGLNFPLSGAFYASGSTEQAENAFSGSIALSMEGIGDVDCESEEQEEALMNRPPARTSSKRSRAAEVHNLSEKRRRQRINEKMKALQKLIPNSNKTDKASMLDEAIEYLKQLQLQLQMLTMRNGSSLHPFYLQGVGQTVQPPQAASLLEEGNSSREVGSFPANQEASMQAMFDLSSKTAPSDYGPLLTRMSENGNSGPSFVIEPSTNAHYRSFNASIPSKVLCKDASLPQFQLDMSHCGQSSSSGVSS